MHIRAKIERLTTFMVVVAMLTIGVWVPPVRADTVWPELVSTNTAGEVAEWGAEDVPELSYDGRYVAFISGSPNLGSTGRHAYLKDRQTGAIDRIDTIAPSVTYSLSLSADGRRAVYTNGSSCYVRDLDQATTALVSSTIGTGACQLADGGGHALYVTSTGLYLKNLSTQSVQLVRANSEASGYLQSGYSISSDGQYVAFTTTQGVYRKDIATGTVVTVTTAFNSMLPGFGSHPLEAMSADGRYVMFAANAQVLPDAPTQCGSQGFCTFRKDMETGATIFLTRFFGRMSRDGNVHTTVVGTGSDGQVHVRNASTGDEHIVSYNQVGELANWAESGVSGQVFNYDGSLMLLNTNASNFAPQGVSLPTYTTTRPDPNDPSQEITKTAPYNQLYITSTARDCSQINCAPFPPAAVGAATWSANPLQRGLATTLSVTIAAPGTAQAVEYFTDTDPGAGNGTPMTLSNNVWTAEFGSNLAVNTYVVGIRAKDAITGVWGPVKSDVLAVYDTANGYVTGHASYVPAANDILPITSGAPKNPNQQPPKLSVGFTNIKAGTNTTAPTGSFDVSYIVKNNQQEFSLSSTAIQWLVVPDSTHASLLGNATMTTTENSTITTQEVIVRFDVVLGAPDNIKIKIYQAGANPNTDNPAWSTNDDLSGPSNLMIKP